MHNPLHSERSAIIGLIAGCVLFGLGSLIIVFSDLGTSAMTFWRLAISAAAFALYVFVRKTALPRNRRVWFFAALAGIFLAFDLALWHESIHAVGPGISTLLNSLQIFFLTALGFCLFRERLSRAQTLSLLIAVAGVALIGSPEFGHNRHALWGFISGLVSGAMLAASMTAIRLTHETAAVPLAALMLILNTAGALAILPIALIGGEKILPDDWRTVSLIFLYGLIIQCLAWGLIAYAIPKLSLAVTGLILLSEPVAALLIDALWLQKPITVLQWCGVLLTLSAIYFGSTKQGRRKKPSSSRQTT